MARRGCFSSFSPVCLNAAVMFTTRAPLLMRVYSVSSLSSSFNRRLPTILRYCSSLACASSFGMIKVFTFMVQFPFCSLSGYKFALRFFWQHFFDHDLFAFADHPKTLMPGCVNQFFQFPDFIKKPHKPVWRIIPEPKFIRLLIRDCRCMRCG